MTFRKTKKLISLLMAVCMIACMICAAVIPVGASEEDVRATADGILHFGKYYDGDYWSSGSCFLINENYILTANHCARLSKLEYDVLRKEKGWTDKEVDNNFSKENAEMGKGFTYKVTIARDFTIDATFVNSSENMDFAIMKLSQPIKNRRYLKLRDSSNVKAAETAYAVGFPSAKDSASITYQYYNQKDIAFESGTVNRAQYTDTYKIESLAIPYTFSGEVIMLTGSTMTAGNSGGPMVDVNGNVIGICSAGNPDGSTCYATAISQVIEVLEALGIKYEKADDPIPTQNEGATVAATEEVKSQVETEADVQEETKAVEPTTGGGTNWGLIIGIIAGIILLIAVIAIVVVAVNKNKKKDGQGNQPPTPPTPPTPPIPPVNEGAGETSVLSAGAGETTVLGGGATGFNLIRKSNNEVITINKPEFVIGKERRRVDYCISDNNSVSRTHAKVRVRSGKCYLTDLGSTNCTYVNDVKLSPNQELELKSGDKIKISDVEFEFNG